MRLLKTHPILGLANSFMVDSPQPANLSYMWNFGSLLGTCLIIQILTGVFLAMHYTPSVDLAFVSVEHIMRDVNYGWLIRYVHANTASFFFIFVYLHIGRGLYYGSYKSPRVLLWSIGVVILILIMAIAFLGFNGPKMILFDCIYNSVFSSNCIIIINIGIVVTPSNRLKHILTIHELDPRILLEYSIESFTKDLKRTLNENAGIYLCINLVNGKLYVGSASKGYMYDRYRAHIHRAKKQGSKLVNAAVEKYGVSNFAFVVLEYVPNQKDIILLREQYYIDLLLPVYNIAKIAGSVMGVTRSIEQRLKQSLYIKSDSTRYQHLVDISKNKTELTKELLSELARNRVFSEETRKKISVNNTKSTEIVVKEGDDILFTFPSIAECAEHFYKNRNKRGPIRWAITTGKLLFNKYTITKNNKNSNKDRL